MSGPSEKPATMMAIADRRGPGGPLPARVRELDRKLIHLSTAMVPVGALVLSRPVMAGVLGAAVAVALAIEVARSRSARANALFLRLTWPMLRAHEHQGLAGATYLAIAYFVAYLVFPLPVAVAAMLFAAVGDAAAALIGRRWGRHRTASGKSWEGFAAGACVNMLLAGAVPGLPVAAGLAGALVAAVLEFLPIPIDDNLRVTLGGGAVVWAVALLVGPAGAV